MPVVVEGAFPKENAPGVVVEGCDAAVVVPKPNEEGVVVDVN